MIRQRNRRHHQGKNLHLQRGWKTSVFKAKLSSEKLELAIGHTRWATHGKVTETMPIPTSMKRSIALVHNGIIENYDSAAQELIKEGFHFVSETDSEVIVQIIAKHYLAI